MPRFMRSVALTLLAVVTLLSAAASAAETTPAPPDWQDQQGPSVYAQGNQAAQTVVNKPDRYAPTNDVRETNAPSPPAPVVAAPRIDTTVMPAIHTTTSEVNEPAGRRLAPPTKSGDQLSSPSDRPNAGARKMLDFGLPTQSIYTVATALAVVIGAFLVFAWALRRGSKGSRNGRTLLPADAVKVLGRVPLAARQFAELLRVGNKLVLVAMTPAGPTTITEISDPAEVDRLVGICQQSDTYSTTKAFEQVFQQFSHEPTGGTFLGDEPLPPSFSPAASAYRSHRGTTRV